jgi:hypothetical protein
MADPFLVLSTTSSIITLLEFTWKLFGESKAIYDSKTGESDDGAVLGSVASDIRRLNDAIKVSPGCDKDLRNLIAQSQAVAQELLDALDEMKIRGDKTRWKSFVAALNEVWHKGKVETFQRRLAQLQGQVASHVQVLIL